MHIMSEMEASAPPPRAKARAKARAKQPDWRRKYREEIAHLRVEAAALSETLVALRAVACSRTTDTDGDSASQRAGPPSAAALWKRLAMRQLASRSAVEQENERLRALVEQRRKETRELRRAMLMKRVNLQVTDGCGSLSLWCASPKLIMNDAAGNPRAAGRRVAVTGRR